MKRFGVSSTGFAVFFLSVWILTAWSGSAIACMAPMDWGDAPDDGYSTLYASNGARHNLSGLFLGAGVEWDQDGQPDILAGTDDDDGVVFNPPWIVGSVVNIGVTSSMAGMLNAWVDFNQDGDWGDPDEQIFTDMDLVAGLNTLYFEIPETAVLGFTYSRFRLNSAGGLLPTGLALDGEVEDYRNEITNPVPLPNAIVLLGVGMIGLAGIGRRKSKDHSY